ncbi:MAG TPA: hypothetical protein VIV83_07545 [Gemmatimonadales bacterium]
MHRCEALRTTNDPKTGAKAGEPCNYYVGAKLYDGRWLCHWHKPADATPAPEPEKPAPRPPKGGKIDSPDDAQRLAAWGAQQVALGHLPHQRGNSIANLCREFRRAFAESGTLAKWMMSANLLRRSAEAARRGDRARSDHWWQKLVEFENNDGARFDDLLAALKADMEKNP